MSEGQASIASLGKYLVRGVLGQGAMGMVYHAYDPVLRRDVAIKVVRAQDKWGAEALTRFEREALALARLSNPHVVQVHDFVPCESQPFLVMELVQGTSLAQLLKRNGPFEPRRFLDCAWQTLNGLAAVHEAGVLHRDLKPSNILLDRNGTYKLADFGLARPDSADGTLSGPYIIGTLRYFSPEMARGGDSDTAGDLYALGVTLFELLAGRHPLEAMVQNQPRLLQEIAHRPLPSITQFRGDLPAALVAWVDSLVAFAPEQRPAGARQAIAGLDRVADPAVTVETRRILIDAGAPTERMPIPRPDAGSRDGSTSLDSAGPHVTAAPTVETLRPMPRPGAGSSDSRSVRQRPRLAFFHKILLAIWLVSSAATFVAGLLVSLHSLDVIHQKTREHLKSTASAAALLVDGDRHARLASTCDAHDPYLAELRVALRRFKGSYPNLHNIYTMAPIKGASSPTRVRFVCDASDPADTDGDGRIADGEGVAALGEPYDASGSPMLLAGFQGPSADEDLTHDAWGAQLSGYAPIRDASGASVGLVGIDMPGEDVTAIKRRFIQHTVLLELATLLAFLAAAGFVARRLNRPVRELGRAMRKVADNDLKVSVQIRTGDEFEELGKTFNAMIAGLREHQAIRAAYECHLTREIAEQLAGGASTAPSRAVLQLACRLNIPAAADPGQALPAVALEGLLHPLFELVFANGGGVEEILQRGFLASFPGLAGEEDTAGERAVRVALLMQAHADAWRRHPGESQIRLVIGIARNADAAGVPLAVALATANARLGTDILLDEATFNPIRHMFYADLFRDLPLPGRPPLTVIALKGAVSLT